MESFRIAIVFLSSTPKSGGEYVDSKVKTYNDVDFLLGKRHAVVMLPLEPWKQGDIAYREAVMDSALAHLQRNSDGDRLTICQPDLRVHSEVLARHPAWNHGLQRAMNRVQLQLFVGTEGVADEDEDAQTDVAAQ